MVKGWKEIKRKALHYWELAAIRGDASSRYDLGVSDANTGNYGRALKHWMIAVGSGDADSLQIIREMVKIGHATKDDYSRALRSYQEYLNEIKSDQRDKAAIRYKYY